MYMYIYVCIYIISLIHLIFLNDKTINKHKYTIFLKITLSKIVRRETLFTFLKYSLMSELIQEKLNLHWSICMFL